MTTVPEHTLLLAGLVDSGKTNFLVALDVVLDDQSDSDGLAHVDLANDRSYLQPLREKWLSGVELGRTSHLSPPPPHQLIVHHPPSGTRAGFHLPDLAGETFNAHFAMRTFPDNFRDRLETSTGLLLFVHCDHNADHELIQHPCFTDQNSGSTAGRASQTSDTNKDWQLENASPQCKLVDLLQFVMKCNLCQTPFPIAVMISAWDLVETAPEPLRAEIPNTPIQFLSTKWPLLNQFLHSHQDFFRVRIFGVSARGPTNSAATTQRPRDRVILVDGDHRSSDITRPVRWLLGLLHRSDSQNA